MTPISGRRRTVLNKAGYSTRLYIVAFEFRVAVFREEHLQRKTRFPDAAQRGE